MANTSQHLQILRQGQLVETTRQATYIRYRLADEKVARLWLALRDLGEARLAEVQRLVDTYLADRSQLQAINCDELRKRMEAGDTVVLDVRPVTEYQEGHIAGAGGRA